MFRWLKRLFGRDQNIFRYHDGLSWRYADPIVMDREMSRICPAWWKDLVRFEIPKVEGGLPAKMLELAQASREEVRVRFTAMVREAFKVKPLDWGGYGVTDEGCLMILAQFIDLQARLVKSVGPLLLSPGRAEAPRPSEPMPNSAAFTSEETRSSAPSPELSPAP